MVNGAGPGGSPDPDDMAVFVDRLAAAGSDRSTALAATQIRRRIDAGAVPPGIRKLAEALVASAAEPPSQRRPADEPGSVGAAMNVRNLVVLSDHGPAQTAEAVAALVAEGRRVVVTGPAAGLTPIRSALPAEVADRVVARVPAMAPAELRELRRLVVTDTPARRARAEQQLPAPSAVPSPARVADLCMEARGAGAAPEQRLLGDVLAEVEPQRLEAITGVAHCVRGKLDALGPRHEGSWTWDLLSDLVFQRHRPTFDRLCEEVAQARDAVAAIEGTPPVTFVVPLTEPGIEAIFTYLEYLQSGGRARAFFRTGEQRDVQPVLAQIRVAGQVPETAAEVELILRHREIAERTERIEKYCIDIGVPPLRAHTGLAALADDLGRVAAAARSMAALRHDVLFLRADSPIPPPDVTNAEQIAAEILSFVDRTPAVAAGRGLDRMADALAALAPATAMAPEHERAIDALRARDAAAYADAADAMTAAAREAGDGRRQAVLLARLRGAAPALATAWTGGGGFGLACFQPADALLAQLPPADSADVVIVVGASRLGVERLLLAAVAPRVVAVVAPGEGSDLNPSLLTVLRRAGALVIRAGTGTPGRVMPMSAPMPEPREAQVG